MYKKHWKYRAGNYRIIYSIIDDTILILSIKHRKEAYR
ncbi:MAG: type II toxin-antitoxin system RelE/ParE family toxin [Deltaproteobacteria bacterium]|nr:type II toxin-antitoxin system RelE/ParE family toxin [Deltaproteobacteria bacterium]